MASLSVLIITANPHVQQVLLLPNEQLSALLLGVIRAGDCVANGPLGTEYLIVVTTLSTDSMGSGKCSKGNQPGSANWQTA